MSRNSIRSRLARLEKRQPDENVRLIDWDALARPDGWDAFVASAGPIPPESETKRASRQQLARLCKDLRCTPADLGLFDDAAAERIRNGLPAQMPSPSGFVDLTDNAPQPPTAPPPIARTPEGDPADEPVHDE